jgi:ethanolamine ammonia-lyase small subunit
MRTSARDVGLWARMRENSPARIGVGHVGGSLPTSVMLDLAQCHAMAKDAVYHPLDVDRLISDLGGHDALIVRSRASVREEYLRRPDLGRRLSTVSADCLQHGSFDVAIVIADGLSPHAVQAHAPPLVERLMFLLKDRSVAPLTVATQARVALGDDIAEHLGAVFVIVIIGERPGLTVTDSLGAYLTLGPKVGRRDSERNCVSNIRPGGMLIDEAADRIHWLYRAALRLEATGTVLKDMYKAPLRLPE